MYNQQVSYKRISYKSNNSIINHVYILTSSNFFLKFWELEYL